MGKYLRTLAIAALLLASAPAAHAQIRFGITIGPPPAERAYRVPPQPGPDYEWIEGYWYPQGNRYVWHNGYWTRPPYEGAYWVVPYHLGGKYYEGHWEGHRGDVKHNHGWDKTKQKDERRGPPDDRGRGRGL
jgi:hypothetical protein